MATGWSISSDSVFLHHFPTNSPFMMGYQLPARPPAMNLLAAFFLGQTADRLRNFQGDFLVLICGISAVLPDHAGAGWIGKDIRVAAGH